MEMYYVSRQGHQEGPHSLELIEDKLKSGYFATHDYIYDSKVNDWVLLSRFEPTKRFCEDLPKQDEVTKSVSNDSVEQVWYLLRGNQQSGPFEIREIVSMLQEQKAFEYDFVWSPQLGGWEKVSECSCFSQEKIQPFLQQKGNPAPSQFRRKTPRVEFGASLVLHNNRKLWNGTGFEVSSGGASIEVAKQAFKVGELVVVHFRPSKHVPAFNVNCEVVSCQKSKEPGRTDVFRLGLRFVKVNSTSNKVISELVARGAA